MTTQLQRRLQMTLYAVILIVPTCAGAIMGTSHWEGGKEHTAVALAPSPTTAKIVAAAKAVCLLFSIALIFSDPPGLLQRGPGETFLSYSIWQTFLAFEAFDAIRNVIARQSFSSCFSLLAVFVFLALSTARQIPYSVAYRIFRTYIFSIAWLTTGLMLVLPKIVLVPYGSGLLPGFPFRLNGFFCAANPFGLILAFYLLLPPPPFEGRRPWRVLSRVSMANILVLLLLTQSKASIAGFILGLVVGAAYRMLQAMQFNLRLVFIASCLMIGAVAFAAKDSILETIFSRTDFKASDATTLTGRTEFWEIVLDEWKDRPLFGYGSQTWMDSAAYFNFRGVEGEIEILGHAHNQIVHTLWSDGIVGTIFLAIHFCFVIAAALNADVRLRPGLFSAIVVFIGGGWTEIVVPTLVGDVLSVSYASLVLLLSTACNATIERET